jgi:hypothetical protein
LAIEVVKLLVKLLMKLYQTGPYMFLKLRKSSPSGSRREPNV